MNISKLHHAEHLFMDRYPGGFNHPDMVAIGKKHKMGTMTELAQRTLSKDAFDDIPSIIDAAVKLTTRSSMVSVFEKPKFRDALYGLSDMDKHRYVQGLYQRLYGHAQKGFEDMFAVLKQEKLAKWSLMTIMPAYVAPTEEVFVKPTTAKGVVTCFDLELTYHPTPSWTFYTGYKQAITHMKAQVDPSLSPSNAAFSGFLMMSLDALTE